MSVCTQVVGDRDIVVFQVAVSEVGTACRRGVFGKGRNCVVRVLSNISLRSLYKNTHAEQMDESILVKKTSASSWLWYLLLYFRMSFVFILKDSTYPGAFLVIPFSRPFIVAVLLLVFFLPMGFFRPDVEAGSDFECRDHGADFGKL